MIPGAACVYDHGCMIKGHLWLHTHTHRDTVLNR